MEEMKHDDETWWYFNPVEVLFTSLAADGGLGGYRRRWYISYQQICCPLESFYIMNKDSAAENVKNEM